MYNSSLNTLNVLDYPMIEHRHIVVNPEMYEIIKNRAIENCRPISKQVEYDIKSIINHEKYDL